MAAFFWVLEHKPDYLFHTSRENRAVGVNHGRSSSVWGGTINPRQCKGTFTWWMWRLAFAPGTQWRVLTSLLGLVQSRTWGHPRSLQGASMTLWLFWVYTQCLCTCIPHSSCQLRASLRIRQKPGKSRQMSDTQTRACREVARLVREFGKGPWCSPHTPLNGSQCVWWIHLAFFFYYSFRLPAFYSDYVFERKPKT